MLKSLFISNYAIIRESTIELAGGLNIITGETGAGKSILMGALGLILGERADTRAVMQGADKCVIEAEFDIESYKLEDFFEANELDFMKTCTIRREITAAGKSRAFINDTPVVLPVIKQLGTYLVDIVSQHQTLELNESSFQMDVLDAIAETTEEKEGWKTLFREAAKLKALKNQLLEKEAKSRQDEDYLNFVLAELNELNPEAGEQEMLEATLDELTHAETIQQSAGQVSQLLEGSEQSVADLLREAKNLLAAAAKHQPAMQELMLRIESNLVDLRDVAAELENIAEKTASDPARLEQVESRLQLIYNLQKKHRVTTISELIEVRNGFESQIKAIGSLEEELKSVQEKIEQNSLLLIEKGTLLSSKRESALPMIRKEVNDLLKDVALPNAVFEIRFIRENENHWDESGMDKVDFLFSANQGFDPQPVSKVASGGELSRLMLCIKSLIADKVKLPSIVFDEIDTGISGEAAQKVAQVMRKHSRAHQVIAITHLPQIAGKADRHLYVYKTAREGTTHTHIRVLSETERVEEIGRMLSGENPSDSVLAAARELIGNN